MRLARCETALSPPVNYFTDLSNEVLFVDHLCHFCLVLLCFRARLFIDALWSPAGKGVTSWLSFVMFKFSFSEWYTGSGVVLDCIDS